MSVELVMQSNYLILCHPRLLLPSIFPSIKDFSNKIVICCIRWPKYWNFNFCINPSSEYSGLISFRMNWLDLLAVQGTFKSLLQHHSSKASILWCSAFFRDSLVAQMVTRLPAMRETHSIPGLERSPGEGNGNPLQYSCLENSMDGGAWWATVHGVAKNWTRLSNFTSSHFSFLYSTMLTSLHDYWKKQSFD